MKSCESMTMQHVQYFLQFKIHTVEKYSHHTHTALNVAPCCVCVLLLLCSLFQFYQSRSSNADLRPWLRPKWLCWSVNSLRVCVSPGFLFLFLFHNGVLQDAPGAENTHKWTLNTHGELRDIHRGINYYQSDFTDSHRLLNILLFLSFCFHSEHIAAVYPPCMQKVWQYHMTWNMKRSASLITELKNYSQF